MPGTYSIVAVDLESGELGVGVESHWFSVGTKVPWAEAGVGAVATQALVEVSYGPLGLMLMRHGKTAEEALRSLLASDPGAAYRQVAFIDSRGNVAAHTGEKCIPAAGHVVGEGYSAQANLVVSEEVWESMASAFEKAKGSLADRILAALEAAEEAGGDIRGRQSAALLVVLGKLGDPPWVARRVDLRVEDHPDPIGELKRLLRLHRAYEHMDAADKALEKASLGEALAHYDEAEKLAPDRVEVRFWRAVALASLSRVEEAASVLKAQAIGGNWVELLRRLPSAGILSREAADRLLALLEA